MSQSFYIQTKIYRREETVSDYLLAEYQKEDYQGTSTLQWDDEALTAGVDKVLINTTGTYLVTIKIASDTANVKVKSGSEYLTVRGVFSGILTSVPISLESNVTTTADITMVKIA